MVGDTTGEASERHINGKGGLEKHHPSENCRARFTESCASFLRIEKACMQACKHACNLIVSPSKLVAFVNSKGGVGKSTIAVHYTVAETERGRRVALIDSDVRESSTRWLNELADGISVYRLPTPESISNRG